MATAAGQAVASCVSHNGSPLRLLKPAGVIASKPEAACRADYAFASLNIGPCPSRPLDREGGCLTIHAMRFTGKLGLGPPARQTIQVPRAGRAMTIAEMTVVVFLVAVVLSLLIGWTGIQQREAKHDLAVRMLADLDQALAKYYRSTGSYPAYRGADSAIQATVVLLDHSKTRPILEAFPEGVWKGQGRRNLVDPWGTPLRYYPADSDSRYVKAHSGRPIPVFVSAGPDCDFGDVDAAAEGDNLRSDDPGPEDFSLDQVIREALIDNEEQDSVQKDD